jgi:molybdopterin converting factor small subunit
VVTLRLFAQLREAAGTGRVDVDAGDVAGVLEEAVRRFGPGFAAGLHSASIWVDGEPLEGGWADPLSPHAEVAVIPPVSGGSR